VLRRRDGVPRKAERQTPRLPYLRIILDNHYMQSPAGAAPEANTRRIKPYFGVWPPGSRMA
jgi:hypothetical protein